MNQTSKIPLSSFISYRKGKPARKIFAQNGRYLPILTPEYLRNNGVSKMAVETDNLVIVDNGELILLWDGSNAGEFFRAKQGILASTMVVLDFDTNEVEASYLYYSLKHFEPYLKIQTRGSGIPHVDKEILLSHQIFKLPQPEQIKITEVLTAVDHTITQTERLIAKYQRIKTGLMQDLLTRGIDENGRLRDPRRNPEQFKNTPIGLLPKEWPVDLLGNIVKKAGGFIQTGPFGTQLHASEYLEEGVPVVMPQDVIPSGWIRDENLVRISPEKAKTLQRHWMFPNDVIFARRGDLSRCSVITERERTWICGTDFMLIRLPASEMNGFWLAEVYRHHSCQQQVLAKAVGSTMLGINTPLLSNLIIPRPSVVEQNEILQVIHSFNSMIQIESNKQSKLNAIKQGLMKDLLTGKVSIAPLLAEVSV